MALIDVVIPTFNSATWLENCVHHVEQALATAGLQDAHIIIVDDGSTDDTLRVTRNLANDRVKLIQQSHQGRLQARLNGANASFARYLLLIDTRVEIHADSLKYILPSLYEKESVWTSDTKVDLSYTFIARFWYSIERIFWANYYRDPKPTVISASNFDHFPKGTTALVVPRQAFLDATNQVASDLFFQQKLNDDTAILRYLVERLGINIAPSYSCTYYSRTSILSFMKHANHRGTVLIDGHFRRGTRLRYPIGICFLLAPVLVCIMFARPQTILLVITGFPTLGLAISVKNDLGWKNSLTIFSLFWPFAVSYFIGMIYGLAIQILNTPFLRKLIRESPR